LPRYCLYRVTTKLPPDFGFLPSRWACGALALLLLTRHQLEVSPETVRSWLHRGDLVYRRPWPTVGPNDARREANLARLRELLAESPADGTVVWKDQADINTNREIGRMWMWRGQQAEIPPRTNGKRCVDGSIQWRTGRVFVTEGPKRNENLFLAHLQDLRHRLSKANRPAPSRVQGQAGACVQRIGSGPSRAHSLPAPTGASSR
jgi:hypothetical protein